MNRTMTRKLTGTALAFTLIISALALPVGLSRGIPEIDDAEVLQLAQQGWAEYAKLFDQLQGTLSLESRLRIDGKEMSERGTIRYLRNGNCRLAELTSRVTTPGAPSMALQLHCVNDTYAFRLTRESTSDPWKLEEVYSDKDAQPRHLPIWLFQGSLGNVSPVTLQGRRSLQQLVRTKGFHVERITRRDDGRYRVEFAMQSDNATRQQDEVTEVPDAGSTITSGELVLNPLRHWALDSAKLVRMLPTEETYTTAIAFSFPSDTAEVPSQVHFAFTSDSKSVASGTMDYEVQLVRPEATVAKDRFTLAAFGFAEPDLAVPHE